MKTLLNVKYPRWYQDFSLNQMKNLMNLENVMRADHEETKTDGTQTTLVAIGIFSTFFNLKPNIINELHKSSNLNSVDFLREIYKILTGNDFYEEKYKKCYNCNERIILSSIAFLTLPEIIKELHKRLPEMIMPSLPPKPKPPICLTRQKNSCPYKEELFKRPDWAGYRNALQKWQKQYKLLTTTPKIILSFKQNDKFFINDKILPEIRKQRKNIFTNYYEKTDTIDLQKGSSTKYDAKDTVNIEEDRHGDEDFPSREYLISEISSTSNIYQALEDGKEFDFTINKLSEKLEPMKYKTYDASKLPGANKKSWLGEKNPYYIIAGASLRDEISPTCPVTYEITGIANVTPSNSDEKFFAMLKFDDRSKKIFPSGRENLSRKWQDWLQNTDEDFAQMKEKADELIKNMQITMKMASPELVCDNCCSCRQTRRTEEKLQQSKELINNVQNSEKNKYVDESMTMHTSKPTRKSPINLIASQNETESRNTIINGITKENGQTQYYISGVQRDNMYIPSQVSDPTPKLIRNVPSCSCTIQQTLNKNVSSISEDDISWTKDERSCIGKKYRPDEASSYSCKTYPRDKSCRRNPFMKEIIKKTKFIPDFDYPIYDNPWDILHIAPSKIIETDYEKILKLTPAALPTISPSLNIQEKQKNSSLQELKKVEKNILHKKNNERMKKIKKKRCKDKGELKDMEKKERKGQTSLRKITVNKKSSNLSNKISKLFHRSVKSKRVDKLPKYGFIKKNKKHVIDVAKQLENRKQEMIKLKNMFKSFAVLDNIQPAILPEELLATRRRDSEEIIVDSSINEEESHTVSKEPCGWRTKSEQELPVKKTLTYLCEPDYPMEMIAVHPGGRPCQCRENRSKKKTLMYNVNGLVEKKNDETIAKETKVENEDRIIDGVLYFTPSISPRRSDEYIPEYDLLDSLYDTCVNQVTDERLKLIERYSGPRSLIEKTQKKLKSCNCSNGVKEKDNLADQKKNIAETRQKLMESKLPEERWKMALKDAALMDYFTQRKNDVPCWTSCKKFSQRARSRKLKIVKPVCECKYERKIVERNEEKTKWKTRQERLKALKKQPFMHIVDVSRPMIEDTKFIISGVKTMPQQNEHKEDIKYCISDVAENLSISSPQQIIDGLKLSSPYQTPRTSREDIPQVAVPHRHWSPMNISPGPLPRKDAALNEEMGYRKKVRDEALKLIHGDNSEQDTSHLHHYQDVYDKKELMTRHETKESHMDIKKTIELQSPSKKISNKIEQCKDISHEKIASDIFHKKIKDIEETSEEILLRDMSYQDLIDKMNEIDERCLISDSDNEKCADCKLINLMAIIKDELKKMAAEGYTFAKLPKCYLMPQLQNWIMYRQCITFSETDKKNLMRATVNMWQLLEAAKMPKIEKASLHMTKYQLKNLTYNRAEEIKEQIQKARAIFHSKVRKERVSYARTMWNTMEFAKFPSISFMKIFFTYMASKEADGHVYKPWLPSEINEPNPKFSCY